LKRSYTKLLNTMSSFSAFNTSTVTIESSGTTSSARDLNGLGNLVALVTPSALTGTSFTFQASVDGTTYNNVYNEGTQYSVTVAASRYVALDPAVFAGAQYVKVVSGSSEAAERTITLVSVSVTT
jgi:hypothetical protein